MSELAKAFLVDTANIGLLLLAIGLPAYFLLRNATPLGDWDRKGNVWTGPFGVYDVIGVVVMALAIRYLVGSSTTDDVPPVLNAGSLLFSGLVFLILAAGVVGMLRARGHGVDEIFGLRRVGGSALWAWVLVGGVAAIVLVNGFATWWISSGGGRTFSAEGEQALVRQLRENPDALFRLAVVVVACVMQPVSEEVIFRGYVYPALKRFGDRWIAALASAILFDVLHQHAALVLPLIVLGVLLVWAYEASGSLWVPIGIHAVFNAATVVAQISGWVK